MKNLRNIVLTLPLVFLLSGCSYKMLVGEKSYLLNKKEVQFSYTFPDGIFEEGAFCVESMDSLGNKSEFIDKGNDKKLDYAEVRDKSNKLIESFGKASWKNKNYLGKNKEIPKKFRNEFNFYSNFFVNKQNRGEL